MPELIEREAPLARLRERLDGAAAGRGGSVLLQGAAGVGKTCVLEALRESSPVRVLSARGGELERDLPFGIAAQLLHAAGVERLDGPAGAVLEDTPGWTGDARAVNEGLRRALIGLGPVLVVVDDLHWADTASARWLGYLAPRLARSSVLLVLAARPAEPGADVRDLDRVAADPAVETVRLPPLTLDGTSALVRARLGAGADASLCRACHDATQGNPYFLRELLHRLAATPTPPAAERVEDLALGDVARAVSERLSHLPPAAARLLLAVAVLGDAASLAHVAPLAVVDAHTAADLVATLGDADVLADGPVLHFVHPIVRSAVYGRAPSADRAWAHDRAARLLSAEGHGPEVVGSHLLAAAPAQDPWAVEQLREAARRAARAGARRAAVRLLHRALAEPPRATVRADVLLRLGALEASLHDGRGLAHMQEAHRLERDPVRRARVALELARGLLPRSRPADAVALLERAIAEVGERDPQLVEALESERAGAAWFEGDRRVRSTPAGGGEMALAYQSLEAALACAPADQVVALAERSLAGGRLMRETLLQQPAPLIATYALILAGALSSADRHLETMVAAARHNGAPAPVASTLAMRARQRLAAGDLDGAGQDAREALALGRDNELALNAPTLDATLIELALEADDLPSARAALAAGEHPETLPPGTHFDFLLAARGRLRLAAGDAARGLADLLACGERQEAWGARTPASIPWRSAAALAHPEPERARALVAEEVALARAAAAPGPLSRALRVAAQLGAATSDAATGGATHDGATHDGAATSDAATGGATRGGVTPGGATRDGATSAGATPDDATPDDAPVGGAIARVATLREAVAVAGEARLERARSGAALAAALDDADRGAEAREVRVAARADALACGCRPLAVALAEALAGRDRRRRARPATAATALSPAERRVTELARGELSNRDIAAALGLSEKTVERHLSGAYRKLGIRSRFQLADALG